MGGWVGEVYTRYHPAQQVAQVRVRAHEALSGLNLNPRTHVL